MLQTTAKVLLIGALCAMAPEAWAKLDKKFIENKTKEVWQTEVDAFDPKADLSDSIYQNESAVYIAIQNKLDADYYNDRDMTKYAELGTSRANAIDATYLRRYMVKLNDMKAVEDFGDFEFDPTIGSDIGLFKFFEVKQAFGARVHKPDGSVNDVDISEAFAIEAGKNNETKNYKIAIPGLAPGDVLEYYYLDQYHINELDMPAFNVDLLRPYPTKSRMISADINEALTLEYKTHNGAPTIPLLGKEKGVYKIGIGMKDVGKIPSAALIVKERQLPYYRFVLKNNTSKVRRYPPSVRGTGVYPNVVFPEIMKDGAYAIEGYEPDKGDLGKAADMVRDWQKAHPDATDKDIADAALIAARLVTMTSKKSYNDLMLAAFLIDLCEKIKLPIPASMGLTTSKLEAEVHTISDFTDADPVAVIGDRVLFPGFSKLYLTPGETPLMFDGETVATWIGSRQNYHIGTPREVVIPAARPRDNSQTRTINVTLDPENPGRTDVEMTSKGVGFGKYRAMSVMTGDEVIRTYENYLGVPEKDRYKSKAKESEVNELRAKGLKDYAKKEFMAEADSIRTFRLIKAGVTPDDKESEFTFTATLNDVFEEDGDDFVLNIGQLLPKETELTETQRQPRDIEIVVPILSIERVNLNIDLPEGYTVEPDELAAIAKNVNNQSASFYAEAKINDAGNLEIAIQERYPKSVLPADKWAEFLEVSDALRDFKNSNIRIVKAN